jgi:hypothetical protein
MEWSRVESRWSHNSRSGPALAPHAIFNNVAAHVEGDVEVLCCFFRESRGQSVSRCSMIGRSSPTLIDVVHQVVNLGLNPRLDGVELTGFAAVQGSLQSLQRVTYGPKGQISS